MNNLNKLSSLFFSGCLLLTVGACGDDGTDTGNQNLRCTEGCTVTADCDLEPALGVYACTEGSCVLELCQNDGECEAAAGNGIGAVDEGTAGSTIVTNCDDNADCIATISVCVAEGDGGVCAKLRGDADCMVGDIAGEDRALLADGIGDETVCVDDEFVCVSSAFGKGCQEPACATDADCGSGDVCLSGSCLEEQDPVDPDPCLTDADCDDDTHPVCNVGSGVCECDDMSCDDALQQHDGTTYTCTK